MGDPPTFDEGRIGLIIPGLPPPTTTLSRTFSFFTNPSTLAAPLGEMALFDANLSMAPGPSCDEKAIERDGERSEESAAVALRMEVSGNGCQYPINTPSQLVASLLAHSHLLFDFQL